MYITMNYVSLRKISRAKILAIFMHRTSARENENGKTVIKEKARKTNGGRTLLRNSSAYSFAFLSRSNFQTVFSANSYGRSMRKLCRRCLHTMRYEIFDYNMSGMCIRFDIANMRVHFRSSQVQCGIYRVWSALQREYLM